MPDGSSPGPAIPSVATADGLALAWRAGAAVRDLEFFQFHPTTLAADEVPGGPPALLISEAVRGEGAVLLDAAGYRFMPDYHPDAELAPRDVVSRSIALHLAATGAPADSPVFLDARGIEAARGPGFLARRFPTITAATRAAGYDWTTQTLPVSPAAHYWMGGVSTDLWGRTSVPGLYAAGEVACTGAQGANRLASNSLLEGLVFGRRAVEAFLGDRAERRPAWRTVARRRCSAGCLGRGRPPLDARFRSAVARLCRGRSSTGGSRGWVVKSEAGPGPFSRDALRRLMTADAGVLRSGEQLREAECRACCVGRRRPSRERDGRSGPAGARGPEPAARRATAGGGRPAADRLRRRALPGRRRRRGPPSPRAALL